MEQADQLGDECGVQAGVELVGQEHRAVGEGFDHWADEAEPHERAERLVACVELDLPAGAPVDESDPELSEGGPLPSGHRC